MAHNTSQEGDGGNDISLTNELSLPVTTMCILVGDWVLVYYDGSKFPGEVKEVINDEVKVSVMISSGSFFKWPTTDDCIFYHMKNVIMKL